ncbi:MAG: prolipoprotein diacylglyceryl transferase [Bacteroides sp.]|nr:prolipoprotein diacylglyceryl transferase [Bacteroides sp.]MCM1548648.1 prolipoprotein diacylglyceryl transferase [Clostridium sp.]
MNDIGFPNIGLYLRNIPDGFTIFGVEIKLYGVVIAVGFLLAYLIANQEAKRTGQDPELYLDYLLILIFPAIIAARIYYVIFAWDYYFLPGASFWETFLRIINLRQGGLAIYGGLIGGVLVCLIFARKRKVSFFTMMDTIALGVPLAQMLGRWGNFFNREAFGSYTDSLLAMAIPLEYYENNGTLYGLQQAGIITDEMLLNTVNGCIQVHPTFLYEGMWNLLLFIFLMIWRKHKKFNGEILTLYLGGYGLGRFWIEGLRTDSLMIGSTGIRVSQALALVLVLAAIVFYMIQFQKYKKNAKLAASK